MGKKGPDQAPYSPIDSKTGAPVGIDPGWDYNVGAAAWGQNQAKKLMESEGKWVDLVPWGPEKYGRPSVPIDAVKAALGPRVKAGDVPALKEVFRKAVGGDSVFLKDPTGEIVNVNQAITDHIAEKASRWDGREAYFPFIQELIEDPYEIWVNFARNEVSGRVAVRRRYVKMVQVEKKKTLGLWAEFQDGFWVSQDLFRGEVSGAKRLRQGRMVYGRE